MVRLENERYEYIKEEVVFLFMKYGVNCVPINAFELVYNLGIRLVPYSALAKAKQEAAMRMSNDGFFLETQNEELIYYNDNKIKDNYARVNMTILHEIAHDVLGHTGCDQRSEIEETEAGFFAKYASAPPPLIHRLPLITPVTIQQTFQLSANAARYAYSYYQKWLRCRKRVYLPYEKALLQLFQKTA